MKREEILDKHLGNIYLSKETKNRIINAMKEISFNNHIITNEKVNKYTETLKHIIDYFKTISKNDVPKNENIVITLTEIHDFLCNLEEISKLSIQINDIITTKQDYLWQDNLEDTVLCIPLEDYTIGDDNNSDGDTPEEIIKITNIIPLWEKLFKLLN